MTRSPGTPWHLHLARAPWWARLVLYLGVILLATGSTARIASARSSGACDPERFTCRADVVFGSFTATVLLLLMILAFVVVGVSLMTFRRRTA